MIRTLARRELRNLRWSVVGYAAGIAVYILVLIGFFPTVRDNAEAWEEMMEIYPEPLKEIFGVEDIATLPGFIGAEVLSLIWPIIIAAFAITAASGFVAGEVERGTVDVWLSVPVRRWRLLTGKVAALSLALAVVVAASVAVIWLGAVLVGESLAISGILALSVTMLAFALTVAGYATLLSALLSERGKAGGLAALVTLMAYLAWVVATLSPRWDWLRFASFFTAYNPQAALADGRLDPAHVLVLLGLTIAAIGAALAFFERRDTVA